MKENPDMQDKYMIDYNCGTCESKPTEEEKSKKEYIVEPNFAEDMPKQPKKLEVKELDFRNWFAFENAIDPDVCKLGNGEEIGYKWNGIDPMMKPVIVLIHG